MNRHAIRNASLVAATLSLIALPDSDAWADTALTPDLASLAAAVATCADGLKTGENPPFSEGWRSGVHSSGTPFGVAAIKRKDMKAVMAGMGYSSEQFNIADKGLRLTQHYRRGQYVACSMSLNIEPTSESRTSLIALLAPSKDQAPSAAAREFAEQYMLTGVERTYRNGEFEYAIAGSTVPDLNRLTVFVFKD